MSRGNSWNLDAGRGASGEAEARLGGETDRNVHESLFDKGLRAKVTNMDQCSVNAESADSMGGRGSCRASVLDRLLVER
ncbi:MAG: hypothetical protein V2A79_13660, partial [Planctomycetota bacterium]